MKRGIVNVKVTFTADLYVLNAGGGWQFSKTIETSQPVKVGEELLVDDDTTLTIVRLRHVLRSGKPFVEVDAK